MLDFGKGVIDNPSCSVHLSPASGFDRLRWFELQRLFID